MVCLQLGTLYKIMTLIQQDEILLTFKDLVMKILALTAVFLLVTACGGGSNGGSRSNNTYAANLQWSPGVFMPSSYYANRCINPRSNGIDLSGTYVDENHWLRS